MKRIATALALLAALGAAYALGPAAPEAGIRMPRQGFTLWSPAVVEGGALPADFTGDGSAATLPLEWSGGPASARSYAVIMHHIQPSGPAKWYWVLHDIPPTVHALPRNVKEIGKLGNNSVNGRAEYAPPHSKGPGPKTYVYTLYALSERPNPGVPPERVSRNVLLAAMRDKVIATAELSVTYTRPEGAAGPEGGPPPDGSPPRP